MVIDASAVSLWVGICSLVVSVFLGGLSIWLSLHFKKEADRTNERTADLLRDIRVDARAISNYAMPELQRFGDTSRQIMLGAMNASTQGSSVTTTPTVPPGAVQPPEPGAST